MIVFLLIFSAGSSDAAKKKVIKAVGGTPINEFAMVIDASYDPKLDNFVPGYKMLNVAIMNNSFRIIEMNPQKDQWWIKTKNSDKKFRVIGDLRNDAPSVWSKLPDRARSLISYPLLLPIGARQVIDLFVPDGVPIEDFSEVIIYIDSINATIDVLARQ